MSRLANLLPSEDKKYYRRYLAQVYLGRFLTWQLIIVVALAAILGGEYLAYSAKLKNLEEADANLKKTFTQINIAEIQATADRQNDNLKAASSILKARPALSNVMDEFMKLLPTGISIDSVVVETNPAKFEVKGRSQNRDQVVQLQNRMEKSSLLKIVYAPLSNLTEARDAGFHFILSFEVKNLIKID